MKVRPLSIDSLTWYSMTNGLERKCIVCGAEATKKVVIESATATNIMYYCAEHATEAIK